MTKTRIIGVGLLMACLGWAQPAPVPPFPGPGQLEPDAGRTQRELGDLLRRYPPNLRTVLALDPGLINNQTYMAAYPALAGYLSEHPEVGRNPSYFFGTPDTQRPDTAAELAHTWENMLSDAEVLVGLCFGFSLIAYLVRTFMDNRKWARWTKAQTEAHTKLVDRLTSTEDLLAYANTPAGSRFLQSSPVVDSSPRNVTAPLGRILWAIQGGVVLAAAGIGFEVVSRQSSYPVQEPVHAFGVMAGALGAGFIVSAVVSYAFSLQLGLLERPKDKPAQG
jgi:hypothetical protein